MAQVEYLTDDLHSANLPPWPRHITRALAWHFQDVAHVAKASSTTIPPTNWYDDPYTGKSAFYGASRTDADRMARDGWQDGAKRAAALRERLSIERPRTPKLARWDVAGAVPNVARALSGNPLNMRRLAPREANASPILTLIYDMAAFAVIAAKAMEANAIAAAAITDQLEDAGFACEITTLHRAAQGTFACEVAAIVKQAHAPITLAAAVYGMGHPAYKRRHIFALECNEPKARPLTERLGLSMELMPDPARDIFIIPSAQKTNTTNPIDAFDAQIAGLRAQGCPGIPAA